jgi:hypothetical protein
MFKGKTTKEALVSYAKDVIHGASMRTIAAHAILALLDPSYELDPSFEILGNGTVTLISNAEQLRNAVNSANVKAEKKTAEVEQIDWQDVDTDQTA